MNRFGVQEIRFGRAVCGNLAQAERREWWLANGRGGYAAGTLAVTLARRYHGLLIAPLKPPLGRCLVIAKADAVVVDKDREWPMFANRWSDGSVDPNGYLNIESFHLDGRVPVWRFDLDSAKLEMRIWMEWGHDTTYVAYRLDPSPDTRPLRIRLNLLANARDHHGETRAGDFDANSTVDDGGATMTVHASARPEYDLFVRAVSGYLEPRKAWINDLELPAEIERGLPGHDSHLCIAEAFLELATDAWSGLAVSLHSDPPADLAAALQRTIDRDDEILRQAAARVPELATAPGWVRRLVLAADAFLISRPLPEKADGASVIAGYPWFGDWGRDTMIALPGLTLATGRSDTTLRILETFALFVDRGMLPNVFPGAGETPDYNSADASLWFIESWRAYLEATGDLDAVTQALPVLQEVIEHYRDGTRYGIAVDPGDGLLRAGEPGVQITWMDAKVGDWVVTPRIGKPIEINALWYNALCTIAEFAERMQLPAHAYYSMAEQARAGFRRFENPQADAFFDVLDGPAGNDGSVRPNQIFAVSLHHSPVDFKSQVRIVRSCARELLTSYGLRTLAPSHPDYRPHYEGGVLLRDGGYHQGTVWPWLLGHYALAEYRVTGNAPAAQARLAALQDHLCDAGLGTIGEIFDGAAPHLPRGAPAQAWSVACVLDAWLRLERAAQMAPRTAVRQHS